MRCQCGIYHIDIFISKICGGCQRVIIHPSFAKVKLLANSKLGDLTHPDD